jgi:tRNA A-37 threonylcarbamoyl transferase component Bud32
VGDAGNRDAGADGESWTDIEDGRPDLVEAVPVRSGMVLAGRYAIEKIIGRGGSGVVVRAHDRDLRQVVAIKVVRAELAGQRMWAARLAREVRLARQIQHPHVCRVFDFQQAEGRAFLVMELAAHGTLRDEIRSGALAARPLAERIADARAVASALDAIHRAGIVHRDLSTQNLLRMGDGRVVLSDFGLAVDVSETTSSVHGGTVAYMAPEVLLGAKASFAADVWALGVVMHEMVFGDKPRWSQTSGSSVMLPPELGRKLTDEERAALDACRACAVKDPSRRLGRAGEAGRLLTEPRGWWARQVAPRRPVVYAAMLTIAAAAVAGMVGARYRALDARPPEGAAAEAQLIVPEGEPADWTDVATVLAEVPDRIHCTRLLADKRTVRFVWGSPSRAEDIDTVTRKRVPSPIVPAAYAEGCPDLSSDGKRLVFQGHGPDGRAFAFLSAHPDGRDGVPVVPTAEPSMNSEPLWLADQQTFSFDVDAKHMGIFSTVAGRMTVLPEVTAKPYVTSFRYVSGNRIFVAAVSGTGTAEFSEIVMRGLKEGARFWLPPSAYDLRTVGSMLYYTHIAPGTLGELVAVSLAGRESRRLGWLPGYVIRYPTFTDAGLAFVGLRSITSVSVMGPDGAAHTWQSPNEINSAARCGADVVASVEVRGRVIVERLRSDGRFIAQLTEGPWDTSPICSPDGKVLFYLRQKVRPGVVRCDASGCRTIIEEEGFSIAISPDGRRIALVTTSDKRGPILKIADAQAGRDRELSESETGCPTGWASNDTVWVSRRRGAKFLWMEVDANSGAETGRSVPGSRDCADGKPDPQSPANPDVRVVYRQESQLRVLAKGALTQPESASTWNAR